MYQLGLYRFMVGCVDNVWRGYVLDRGKEKFPGSPRIFFPKNLSPRVFLFGEFLRDFPFESISVDFSQLQLQDDGVRYLMTYIYSITPSDHLLIISSTDLPV